MSKFDKGFISVMFFLCFGLIISFATSLEDLTLELDTLRQELQTYEEIRPVLDAKEYCKKKVRIPNRCYVTVHIRDID